MVNRDTTCRTQEAVDNIREAIEAYLESVEVHGEPIPIEDLLIKPVEVVV